ncbi:5450_t:CDS:2 [Entrophospora sp. SA101]|nr:7095_t:CDS:2 [Entrophospora sp. SA101]CAJ0838612.1 5450_t:CDS:2 [Entrophospora sp. SA101]
MDNSENLYREHELLTEHFGFLPISIIDDIINVVNEIIYAALTGIEVFVGKELGQVEEAAQGMHKVETLLENLIDRNYEIFERYTLDNIFAIRENVQITLNHYKGLDFTIDQSEEDKIDKELKEMRRSTLFTKLEKDHNDTFQNIQNQIIKLKNNLSRLYEHTNNGNDDNNNRKNYNLYIKIEDEREEFIRNRASKIVEQIKLKRIQVNEDEDNNNYKKRKIEENPSAKENDELLKEVDELEILKTIFNL